MAEHIRLDVDFYGTGEASVKIATELVGERLREACLVLLSGFALRQLHNLGRIEPTDRLCEDLSQVSDRIAMLAAGSADYGVELIERREGAGERRFVVTVKYDAEVALLHLDTPGFGGLGQGVNYFAPKSVLVLVQYLVLAYKGDQSFLLELSECARLCAAAYRLDKITTLNQATLARAIAKRARPLGAPAPVMEIPAKSEPLADTSLPAAAPPPSVTAANYCQSCGLPAPTKRVHFYQNIGMLIMRRHGEVKGELCKPCIDRHFWNMTGKTMLFGWWGLISLIVAPLVILNNTFNWIGSLGMKSPPVRTARGPSPIWVLLTIGGFLFIGYMIYAFLTASLLSPASPTSSLAIGQETCAVTVVGFDTFLVLKGSDVQPICDEFVAHDPSLYRISLRPPSSPVICRQTVYGVEATVIDTSSSRSGGATLCQSLRETVSE